ncbi:MAG: hypothetical protein ACI8X5_001076 [Planctomycetota bacterium]|jgi:hypothetical protein
MNNPPEPKAVLLDMDGVLVDFHSAALALHGGQGLLASWPTGEWNMAKVLGITIKEFWAPITEQGADFWANLSWYPWADELIELCEGLGGFVIATSPSHHPSSAAGKVRCLRDHFGPKFRDYMIGPHKYLMAGSGMVLVDDRDTGIADFRAVGGSALRFPRRWNADHALSADPLAHVRVTLPGLLRDSSSKIG